MSFSGQCTELEDIILSKISRKQTRTIEQNDPRKNKELVGYKKKPSEKKKKKQDKREGGLNQRS